MIVLSDKGMRLTDQQAPPIAPTPKMARQKCIHGREVLKRAVPWDSMRGTTASMPKKKRKKEIWMISRPAPRRRMRISFVTLTSVIITAQKAPWGYPLRMNHEKGFVEIGSRDVSKTFSSVWVRDWAGREVICIHTHFRDKTFLVSTGVLSKSREKRKSCP